jgi:TerC family integral membrane protein
VFKYFRTPAESQPTVLTYGIITAGVLRLVMILLGTELIASFRPLLIGFAGILLWSAYGLLTKGDEDEDEDLSDNAVVRLCRQLLPVTDQYDGNRFFTAAAAAAAAAAPTSAGSSSSGSSSGSDSAGSSGGGGGGGGGPNGRLLSLRGKAATPLLLTLAVVEVSDVLFAVDSIPAVFGVTLDPLIIYTSNMFAILSLRSLYSFVSTVMTELRFLDKAVALVLGFIGLKMLLEFVDVAVPTDVSLLVVGLLLGGGVAASMLLPESEGDKGL